MLLSFFTFSISAFSIFISSCNWSCSLVGKIFLKCSYEHPDWNIHLSSNLHSLDPYWDKPLLCILEVCNHHWDGSSYITFLSLYICNIRIWNRYIFSLFLQTVLLIFSELAILWNRAHFLWPYTMMVCTEKVQKFKFF